MLVPDGAVSLVTVGPRGAAGRQSQPETEGKRLPALLSLLPQQGLLGMREDDIRPWGMKAR